MSTATWAQDEQGRYYSTDRFGKRIYSPTTADRPKDSLLKTADFDTASGQWKKKTNWNNVISLGALAGIAAPAAVAAAGAIGGGVAAGGSGGAASVAPNVLNPALAGAASSVPAITAPVAAAAGKGLMSGIGVWGPVLNAAINGVANIYGTKAQSAATSKAGDLQAKASADALAFSREQEAERVREYNQEQATSKAAWDAQEARRAPYREAGQNALMQLSQLVGMKAPNIAGPREMAAGFTPGAQGTAPPPTQPGMMTLAELLKPQQPKYLQSGVF